MCCCNHNAHARLIHNYRFAGSELNGGDKDGHTPLHLATAHQHYTTVQVLLQLGADVSRATRY